MSIPFRLPSALGVLTLTVAIVTAPANAQCPAGSYGSGLPGFEGPTNPGPAGPAPGSPESPNPAGPTTPGPSDPGPNGPRSPRGPNVPVTGGPARGPGPGRAGRTGARGMPLTFERGRTSKDRLKLDWEHPVPPERGEGTTAAGALPLADALAAVWGDDHRPLLVLRECTMCAGTDLPLLNNSKNNDRTMLMAKWFKIVRLPPHVTKTTHAFHNLFAGYEFIGPAPHFYLLSHPGAQPISFTGAPTQTNLWMGLSKVVKERYQLDAGVALKGWLVLLDKFDNVDAQRFLAKEQLRKTRADQGPRSTRAKKLQARIDDLDMERAKLIAKEKKITDLVLKPFPKPEKVASK